MAAPAVSQVKDSAGQMVSQVKDTAVSQIEDRLRPGQTGPQTGGQYKP